MKEFFKQLFTGNSDKAERKGKAKISFELIERSATKFKIILNYKGKEAGYAFFEILKVESLSQELRNHFPNSSEYIFITSFNITERFRQKGFGSELINKINDLIKSRFKMIGVVYNFIDESLDQDFYKKYGWIKLENENEKTGLSILK